MVSKEKTNRLKTFLVFLFLILGVFQVDAANKEAIYQHSVSGIVVSVDNTLLPGVSVVIVGTNVGTQTDFDGKYTINAKKGDQLQFSFLGMKTKKITVGSSNIINVTLEEEVNSLDEIVVIGYGSQNKREVTGAISSVKADNLTKIPTINAVEALQGRVPGLTIINNGSPGSVPTVRIRGIGTLGDNNPVYVVDDVVGRTGCRDP